MYILNNARYNKKTRRIIPNNETLGLPSNPVQYRKGCIRCP